MSCICICMHSCEKRNSNRVRKNFWKDYFDKRNTNSNYKYAWYTVLFKNSVQGSSGNCFEVYGFRACLSLMVILCVWWILKYWCKFAGLLLAWSDLLTYCIIRKKPTLWFLPNRLNVALICPYFQIYVVNSLQKINTIFNSNVAFIINFEMSTNRQVPFFLCFGYSR